MWHRMRGGTVKRTVRVLKPVSWPAFELGVYWYHSLNITNAKQYADCSVLPTVGVRYSQLSSSGLYTSGRGAGMTSETGPPTVTAIGLS